MRVLALVGSSGTGKSHRALFIARQNQLQYIVDDGLLIHINKRIAGRSAKREQTYIAAVKRAIFHDQAHLDEVQSALEQHKPDGILLIGTSDEMVEKIAKRLGLPEIEKKIYIQEIASQGEIDLARRMRQVHGKHVIPLPSVELKADFSGYFLDKLRVFGLRRGTGLDVAEKSVVRPTFSYLGRYTISQKAMQQIVLGVSRRFDVVVEITRIRFVESLEGLRVEIEVITPIGERLPSKLPPFMKAVKEALEHMTAQNILRVHLLVKGAREIKK